MVEFLSLHLTPCRFAPPSQARSRLVCSRGFTKPFGLAGEKVVKSCNNEMENVPFLAGSGGGAAAPFQIKNGAKNGFSSFFAEEEEGEGEEEDDDA